MSVLWWRRLSDWIPATAAAAAVLPLVSIAVFNIVLALAALLAALERRLRFPPRVLPPLGCFLGWTLICWLLSGHWAAGWPQIRKFYVFLILPVVYGGLCKSTDVWRLVLLWSLTGAASAAVALVQFWLKWMAAAGSGAPFYTAYVADRITGLMSHWMTFSGQMASVLCLAVALAAGSRGRMRWAALGTVALLALALVLGLTRGMWIAATAGLGVFVALAWPRWLLAAPVAVVLLAAVSPGFVRQRAASIIAPHGDLDSNRHRAVLLAAGVNMVRAHPLLGLGPEQPGRQFSQYVPAWAYPLPDGWYGHLHNTYLQYAAERGVPGLIFFLWLALRTLFDFFHGARTGSGQRRWLLLGLACALVVFLVGGLFEFNLGDSEVLALFLACIGAGYRVLEDA